MKPNDKVILWIAVVFIAIMSILAKINDGKSYDWVLKDEFRHRHLFVR